MAQTGFLIGISSASSSLHATRNQNFRFQMLTFHFPIEEMGGGNHLSSLSHSSSPGICQKEILSPANFCPCCRTDTKSREAAKPGSAAIPRHPMAQDQLEERGGRTPPPLPYICHLLLAQSIMGCMVSAIHTYGVPCLAAETASGPCWSSHAPHSTASPNSFPRHGPASHEVRYCRS